ncbi:MAG TPA: helix-turn-helix domain-containing protein [Steroidobacteraceae bacterium]
MRRIGSICTGAFLLAHAGLLDGRRATTHWNSTARLAEMFPKIRLEPNTIYMKDGPIYTTAGVTASMDLALALVEEDHGRSIALRVAKELILFLKRPGGQSQFSMHLEAQAAEIGPIRDILEWIRDTLAENLAVDALAARLGMSSRNFARLFKRETDVTPGDFVEAARVEAARRMLEESDTQLKKVASMCGFAGHSGLRRAFMRRLKVAPADYRSRFRPGPATDTVVAFPAMTKRRSRAGVSR